MQFLGKGTATFLAALFVLSLLPAPAAANPAVPYCGVGAISHTANADMAAICEQITGRVFPEAIADPDYIDQGNTGFATDFVSYPDFVNGLNYLAAQNPDWITVHHVADSFGLTGVTQSHDSFPIYMLEVTNKNSPIPREEKLNLLFMLSIHGNEKGGREGGFRVLEDLVSGKGFALETVQNGAGLPEAIARPTGEGDVTIYRDYLDFMNVFLLFPNADGWAHDDVEYASSTDCLATALYCRGNGHGGTDLNRQLPTIGWQDPNRNVMGEPEAIGYGNWIVDQREQENLAWNYAIDIHGMLNHQNFGAIMLPAGSFTPQEMQRSLRLAETLKERFNADPHFSEWRTLFSAAETAWANSPDLCGQVDCPAPASALSGSPPTEAVSSSQFAEYYTVIDAIGYTDSGFSGDFFAQTTGLNAPGYDIELAYNHITTDSQYEGPGALFNDYHVHMVRHIVKSFMDAAALDVRISYETGGARTAYIPPSYVATNVDDDAGPGGWAAQNPGDDAWDYGDDQPFFARPAKFWEDQKAFLCEACGTDAAVPGVLEARTVDQLTASSLANFDTLVIPGTAINQFIVGDADENRVAEGAVDQAKVDMVMQWVEDGGNLVLTDAGLKFFDLAGLTDDAVDRTTRYMGGIRMDLDHPLLDKVRGGVKQTYEPTPLGYAVGANAAPNWFIDPAAFNALGGAVAGLECGGPNLGEDCSANGVSLGQLDVGAGKIQFIGALLPDPTEEFYHPYGLDHYATTYSGNQIMRNMLGWDEVFASPPITITEGGKIIQTPNEADVMDAAMDGGSNGGSGKDSPGLGLVAILAGLAAVAISRRR